MDLGLEALLRASANGRDHHRPDLYRLARLGERARLADLLKRSPGIQVFDQLRPQLAELLRAQNPSIRSTPDTLHAAVDKHLGATPPEEYGVWAHYPWSDRLVHLLDEQEFALVRTDRNRNKITREEQERLGRLKVGVIGLSVGQSVSLTLALERGFGEIRLADFDQLDLSNLNRIRTGTQHLGLNKAIIVAREIAEIDPFLKVVCFTEGLTRANIDAFFMEGGQLDVVVEECDSVDIKILARQKAKALRIPVVMDTSDRGCLDIERFDLEPERSIMHGWIDHLDLEAAGRPMTAEEKVPYISPISGLETLSPRMKASLMELGQSVTTWPQLATSVVLGGALAADAVRRIALGQLKASGRWYVDLDELIADPVTAAPPLRARPDPEVQGLVVDVPLLQRELGSIPAGSVELTESDLLGLIEAGGAAPSAGNMQPWRFLWIDQRLLLFHDAARSYSRLDPDHRIAHIALGACIENIVLRAHALGLEVRTALARVRAEPALLAAFTFQREKGPGCEPHPADHLASMIGRRCTNRKVSTRVPLDHTVAQELLAAVRSVDGCEAVLLEGTEELAAIASICGRAERIRVMNPTGHDEFFHHELRWSPEEAARTGDGLDVATLEVSPSDAAGLRVASDPRAMELVAAWKGGRSLERLAERSINASSAVLLVTIANDSLAQRLAGGRAVERMWMTANARSWAVHPISAPIFLGHVLPLAVEDLAEHERTELRQLRQELLRTAPMAPGHAPLFMVRLFQGESPSQRALRRPVHSLILQPEPSMP